MYGVVNFRALPLSGQAGEGYVGDLQHIRYDFSLRAENVKVVVVVAAAIGKEVAQEHVLESRRDLLVADLALVIPISPGPPEPHASEAEKASKGKALAL